AADAFAASCGPGLASLRVRAPFGPVTVASLHLHWPWPYSQRRQIDRLMPLFRDAPGPLLMGGDFNAAPWSHAVARIAEVTRATPAPGLRFTFHGRVAALTPELSMPIDHVLADGQFRAVEIRVSGPVGSDHRAVIARFSLMGPVSSAAGLAAEPEAR
ncbi:MAG: endonuclease/exonuclease/phosphatase family protein, partial [Pseudomonadota bacterium]